LADFVVLYNVYTIKSYTRFLVDAADHCANGNCNSNAIIAHSQQIMYKLFHDCRTRTLNGAPAIDAPTNPNAPTNALAVPIKSSVYITTLNNRI